MYHIKKDKRAIESSTMIYNGLKSLMKQKNFEDIKVTEIVSEAQVGRATFYRNFDAPIDVLRYVSDRTFRGLLEHLLAYRKDTPVQRSSDFLITFLQYFNNHAEIVELLISAGRQDVLNDSFTILFENMYSSYAKITESPEVSWKYFIAIRSGITINILVQWIKDGKQIPPKKLGEIIYQQLAKTYSVNDLL